MIVLSLSVYHTGHRVQYVLSYGRLLACAYELASFGFFLASRRRHTRCALVTGVQTCARPISGSVAVRARPALPKTRSTSGKVASILSVCCSNCLALVMEIPGKADGMYRMSPSSVGGMNSLDRKSVV